MAVDGVVVELGGEAGFEVGDDLVAVEVEVDPFVRGAAFGAAQETSIEVTGELEVMDR